MSTCCRLSHSLLKSRSACLVHFSSILLQEETARPNQSCMFPWTLSNRAIPKLNFLVSGRTGRISVVMSTFSVFGPSYIRSSHYFALKRVCVCVSLCFVDPILGKSRSRCHSLSQGTWGGRIPHPSPYLRRWLYQCCFVWLCFIKPILGNRYGPGINSLRQ